MAAWRTVAIAGLLILPGCTAGGDEAEPPLPTETVLVGFVLERDLEGLFRFVEDVSDPSEGEFRAFVDTSSISDRFGASEETRSTALETLASLGVDAEVDPTGAVAIAEMSFPQVEDVFDTEMEVVIGESGASIWRPRDPDTSAVLDSGAITAVVGRTGSVDPTPVVNDAVIGDTDIECEDRREPTVSRRELQLRYDVPDARAEPGADYLSIGFLSADPLERESVEVWAECNGADAPEVEVIEVGDLPLSVSAETDPESVLDITAITAASTELDEVSMILFDEESPMAFALAEANGAGRTDLLSISYLYCETDLGAAELELTEWMLAALAATGTTTLVSAGDYGSTECGRGEPSVAYPASSPHVTTVGGTQLPPGGVRPAHPELNPGQAWNRQPSGDDYATGGGNSAVFQGRSLPDLAMLAEPDLIGSIAFCGSEDLGCSWRDVGGTSIGAPSLAGAIRTTLARRGVGPVGLIAPVLEEAGPIGVAFSDVVQGTNDLDSVGCCSAGVGYDLTTGWGEPRLSRLLR